jgi:serine/threonine protein kinase
MQNFSGQSIDRYHILGPLGEGGMAIVYKAFDTRLECDVAVKFIRSERLNGDNSTKALKRFKDEAQKTAALSHPNIVPVIDYGEFDGTPYLVMRYMPGGTLKQALQNRLQKGHGPYPYPEAAAILAPIARALEVAHQAGLVHRDVKPSNILMTQTGQPMLTDFGVAKILENDATLDNQTGVGIGIGTPEYMAPEQWEGKEIDRRADVYALGVVFYELITGRTPYRAETIPAMLIKVFRDPLPRPREFVKDIPEAVEKVLFKALAKKAEDRYADMDAFAQILEKLANERQIKNQSKDDLQANKNPTDRTNKLFVHFLSIFLILIIVVTAWYSRMQSKTLPTQIKIVQISTTPMIVQITTTPNTRLKIQETDTKFFVRTPSPSITSPLLLSKTTSLTSIPTTLALNPTPQQSTFVVKSNQTWQDTKIEINQGDYVELNYLSGKWTTWVDGHPMVGPEGNVDLGDPKNSNHPVPSAYPGVLIGKIGDGAAFAIGKGISLTSLDSGPLYLQINDDYLVDNSGTLSVSINVINKSN